MMRLGHKQGRRGQKGFTLVETMASVVIIAMVSGMVVVQNENVDATERLDRAADEVVAALRYARAEAMGHGSTVAGSSQPDTAYGVAFNTTANTVTVYQATYNTGLSKWNLPGSTVSCMMYPTQTYLINFATQPEVEGVTISAVSLGTTADTQTNTTSPYVCQYLPFGEAENCATATGTVTLSYAGKTRTIIIPQIGDATKN